MNTLPTQSTKVSSTQLDTLQIHSIQIQLKIPSVKFGQLSSCQKQQLMIKRRSSKVSHTIFPHIVSSLEYFPHPSEETIQVVITLREKLMRKLYLQFQKKIRQVSRHSLASMQGEVHIKSAVKL